MEQNIKSWWQSPYRSEPSVAEMLDDPIVHLVMARDCVRREDVSALMRQVALRLNQADKQAA